MWEENLALGTWVHAMRQYKRKGKLSEERMSRLDDLGFSWRIHSNGGDADDEEVEREEVPRSRGRSKSLEADTSEEMWEESYNELVEYKKRFGHCRVPKKWEENPQLGSWVSHLRERKKAGKLDEEQVAELDRLNFTWNFQTQWEMTWEERFEQLKNFKEIHGSCAVSKNDPAHKTLYQWIHDVRGNRRRGRLAGDRIKRLNEIGFIWNPANNPGSSLAQSRRKRGRTRKTDGEEEDEEAVMDTGLWGATIVDLEETETDTDTETAPEDGEDDHDKEGGDYLTEQGDEAEDGAEEGDVEEQEQEGEIEGEIEGIEGMEVGAIEQHAESEPVIGLNGYGRDEHIKSEDGTEDPPDFQLGSDMELEEGSGCEEGQEGKEEDDDHATDSEKEVNDGGDEHDTDAEE